MKPSRCIQILKIDRLPPSLGRIDEGYIGNKKPSSSCDGAGFLIGLTSAGVWPRVLEGRRPRDMPDQAWALVTASMTAS